MLKPTLIVGFEKRWKNLRTGRDNSSDLILLKINYF